MGTTFTCDDPFFSIASLSMDENIRPETGCMPSATHMFHFMKNPPRLFACAVIGLLTPVLTLLASPLEQPLAVTPAPRLVSHSWMSLATWYRMHADQVEQAEKGDAKVVFVGDSITEGWHWGEGALWKEHFEPMQSLNLGIGGDMTQNVLWRLQHGAAMNLDPDYVICLIGTNNFGHTDEGPEAVAEGVFEVVRLLQEKFSNAQIACYGVFPRSELSDHLDRAKIRELNARVSEVDNWERVTFLDIGEQFLDAQGSIPSSLMPDFLHLSPEGYAIWAESILDWMASFDTLPRR